MWATKIVTSEFDIDPKWSEEHKLYVTSSSPSLKQIQSITNYATNFCVNKITLIPENDGEALGKIVFQSGNFKDVLFDGIENPISTKDFNSLVGNLDDNCGDTTVYSADSKNYGCDCYMPRLNFFSSGSGYVDNSVHYPKVIWEIYFAWHEERKQGDLIESGCKCKNKTQAPLERMMRL